MAIDPLTAALADLLERVAGRCFELAAAVRKEPPAVYVAARLLIGLQAVHSDLESLDLTPIPEARS